MKRENFFIGLTRFEIAILFLLIIWLLVSLIVITLETVWILIIPGFLTIAAATIWYLEGGASK